MRYFFVIFVRVFFLNCKLKGYSIICPELCGACFLRDSKNAHSNYNYKPVSFRYFPMFFIQEKKIMCLCFFWADKSILSPTIVQICIHVLLFMTKMNWKGLLKLNLIIWYFLKGYIRWYCLPSTLRILYCVHRKKKVMINYWLGWKSPVDYMWRLSCSYGRWCR